MTSRQNDTNREPLSIAEEILNDLKATEPSPAKGAETTEKTLRNPDPAEVKELPKKSEAQKPIKKPDPLMNEVISLGFDEETEDDTDEFIIPAGEISPSGEMETMKGDTEKAPEPQPQENKKTVSESFKESDFALPPTKEEKRDGTKSTKLLSPEHDDADDFALPPTKEEKRNIEKNTKLMSPDHDYSDDFALPPTKEEKRDGAKSTKLLSPDHDYSDDFALPPTKEEKLANASGTKVIKSERNDTEDFIFTKYRRSSSHSENDKRRKKKNKKKFRDKPFWKKLLIILGWIFGALLGIILALVIAFFVSSCIGKKQLTNYDNMNVTAPQVEGATISVSQGGRTVEYNGKNYKFNENMTTILCIGVDKTELGTEDDIVGTGGQADALFLVAMDMKSGETDIIAIPRDIVTDIELKSASGKYMGTEKKQICLSYAYGDGKHTSCQNTQTAVERLFYGLPIQSYFAIDIEAIGYLNDAVGGVTVTMKDDFFRSLHYGVQTHHYKGEVLTLDGENAIRYVQQREVAQLESSTERLDRQMNYMNAFSQKAISMTKEDLGVPIDLFNIVKDNSATDLNVTKISALAEVVVKGMSAPDFKKIPGELTSDGTYAVYNVDTEKFYELFLETFYIPQS